MLTKNINITDAQRRLRKINTHKPDFCGSCKEEQHYDTLRYCHNCQKDPWYNPDNLDIGRPKAEDYFYYQNLRNKMFPYDKCIISDSITKEEK
jgi:hypothetical protein